MKLDRLVRLISQQWAIESEVLENWCQILDAKLSGLPLPDHLLATEERIAAGRSSARSDDEPFIRDGNIAIVPVVGTLVKANTLFSCDATYGDLRRSVSAAEKAKGIDAIILDGDTPGGTVAGAQETGDFLARVNQRVPLYGWVDDLAASAGYWLLSQTRMIGAHAAADIGSIGVLGVHYDRSGQDEQNGVKRTVLAVGAYKAAGNDTAPLTADERSYLMDRLEQTYSLFIAAVTKGRPQLASEVIREMQSRVYKAGPALKLGLIDHIMGRDEYIDHIKRQTKGAVSVPAKGVRAMNLEELNAQHPDLVSQIEAAAREGMIPRAEHDAALASARASLLALHSAIFGEEAGKKLDAAAQSGINAEQAKALGITAETGDATARAAILEGITAVAAPGLKPGQVVKQPTATIDTSAIYASRQPR